MDKVTAKILVANLIDRISPAGDGRAYRLDGVLTQKELDALSLLAERQPERSVNVVPVESAPAPPPMDSTTADAMSVVPIIGRAKLDSGSEVVPVSETGA